MDYLGEHYSCTYSMLIAWSVIWVSDSAWWWFFWSSVLLIFVHQFCQMLRRSVKSLTKGVGFLFSPYRLFRFCFLYFEVLLFGTYLFKIDMSSWWIDFFCHFYVPLISDNFLSSEIYFIWYEQPLQLSFN